MTRTPDSSLTAGSRVPTQLPSAPLYPMQSRLERVATEGAPPMPPSKRVFDLLAAMIALLILSPLMLLITLGIKLVSPGPILFKQERVGRLGRRFTCYKFRSMHVGNDASEHQEYLAELIASDQPMIKLDQQKDPRVIPLGRLLRASALDELPQLFNVIKGDMSLIGPRPCIPYEYDEYTDDHKLRMLATPGMTGLWQVSGKNHTTFEKMVALDVDYAYRQSPALDLWILLRTPGVIFSQLLELKGKRTQKDSPAQGVNKEKEALS